MRPLLKPTLAALLCSVIAAPLWAAPAADASAPAAIDVPTPLGDVTLSLLVDRLHKGELTPEQAWRKGELSLEDALYLLGHAGDWGTIEEHNNAPLRQSLARLIVEHDADRLGKKLSQTPQKVRLWIGDYLQAQGDERAVQVLESVLSEFKAPAKEYAQHALLFQTIERLGSFYERRGQEIKAAESWLRLEPMVDKPDWMVADAAVGAARLYLANGQEAKANELYAKVPAYGADYFTTLARLDPARKLMSQGKHAQARADLEQAIKGAATDESRAILLSILSYSYRQTGEWEPAQKFAAQALQKFEAMSPAQRNGNAKSTYLLSQETLAEASSWLKSPIRVEPGELKLAAAKEGAQPIVRRLRVQTFRPVTLSVSSTTPQIKARVMSGDGWSAAASTEQVLVVEIAPGAPVNATLSITSKQYPNVEAKVPVLSGAGS